MDRGPTFCITARIYDTFTFPSGRRSDKGKLLRWHAGTKASCPDTWADTLRLLMIPNPIRSGGCGYNINNGKEIVPRSLRSYIHSSLRFRGGRIWNEAAHVLLPPPLPQNPSCEHMRYEIFDVCLCVEDGPTYGG